MIRTKIKLFASHDWGVDRANHERVRFVVRKLQAEGFDVWFDEDDISGNIIDSMCKGIDESTFVLIFVTGNYMRKVESEEDSDNVRREFMYASRYANKLIPIRFSDDLPRVWSGPVGMLLGHTLYVDMASTSDVQGLIGHINTKINPPRLSKTPSGNFVPKIPSYRPTPPPSGPRSISWSGNQPDLQVTGTSCIRERTKTVVQRMGGQVDPAKHTKDVVNDLYESVVAHNGTNLTLVEKLAAVERELGI